MTFKTTPLAHQAAEFEAHRDDATRALFWEMGCGKTKATIDAVAHQFRSGRVDGLLVLAPPGVEVNWVTDELPKHMPDDVPYRAHAYATRSAGAQWHKAACAALLGCQGELPVLVMSYNAFRTYEGRRTVEAFLHRRRTFYVLDESQRIKRPGAKRTISVLATGRRAPVKWILSGTPITNKPFDVYSQMKFLDEEFWVKRGFADYSSFKTAFGIWVDRVTESKNGRLGRFEQVVAFKDLDRLGAMVAEVSSRVLKADVLDLPPKVYQKRYFDLSPAQEKAYADLRRDFATLLESGEPVTAALMVTRLLRLQQVACGYLPSDAGPMVRFPENPRLAALEEILEDLEGSAIIFARFTEDIDQVCALLGDRAVRYDGQVDQDGRLGARRGFQAGEVQFFVGNPAAAGVGLTLHRASTVIYYSNSFDLEHRLQSEDRAHRIGQTRDVTIIDLIARGTVDHKIVASLRDKLSIASQVTGDGAREWI